MAIDLLSGKRIAILATNGFEQSELESPRNAIESAGGSCQIVSILGGEIRAWTDGNWGGSINVDRTLKDARPEDFDALMLPGGVINSDRLRLNLDAVLFVLRFFETGKPVGAICHAPWMLVEAGTAKGRKLTSWPSLKTDLRNAGAEWVDAEVIVDQGLVTSRMPADLPAFNQKLIEEIAEGRHISQMIRTIRNSAELI